MQTIICMKWGNRYNYQYVNRLYKSILRHTRNKTRLICFTDNKSKIDKEVICLPLPNIKIPNQISLFETVLVSANDELVENFLNGNIKFNQISVLLFKIINLNEFKKLKYKKPNNLEQIIKLNRYVRLKTLNQCIK